MGAEATAGPFSLSLQPAARFSTGGCGQRRARPSLQLPRSPACGPQRSLIHPVWGLRPQHTSRRPPKLRAQEPLKSLPCQSLSFSAARWGLRSASSLRLPGAAPLAPSPALPAQDSAPGLLKELLASLSVGKSGEALEPQRRSERGRSQQFTSPTLPGKTGRVRGKKANKSVVPFWVLS